jgi:hypothetical protein
MTRARLRHFLFAVTLTAGIVGTAHARDQGAGASDLPFAARSEDTTVKALLARWAGARTLVWEVPWDVEIRSAEGFNEVARLSRANTLEMALSSLNRAFDLLHPEWEGAAALQVEVYFTHFVVRPRHDAERAPTGAPADSRPTSL